jgi:outer membrane protein assembly factor BamB
MKFLLTSATVVSLTFSVSAQEWTRFLGTNGGATGSAPGLPSQFTDADYAWRTELPGSGVSSPVVWGDRIFLTAELSDSGQRAVLCHSLSTGKELWRYADKFDAHGKHKFNSFASSTPVVDKDRVYFAWTSGGAMRALALTHDGKRVWEKQVGPYAEQHGSGASPVLAGGALVISSDCESGSGGFTALKPADGSVLWKFPRSSHRTPFSTPLTFEEKPGQWRVVVSSNPKALTCIDAKDGKVLWELDNLSPNLRAVGSPAIANGVIFAAIGQGGTAKGSIAAKVANGKAEKVWEGKKAMPYVPTPLSLGDHFLFLGDGGILSSVRASDGEMLWSERVFQDQAYSSPVSSGDKVFCISRNGTVAAINADPKEFKRLGTTALGDPCDSTPAIAGGKLIIRTAHKLLCIPGAKVQP